MNTKLACVSVAMLTLAFANSTAAQEHVGIRVGVSGDPDQFVFGGHIETSPLLDRLVFRPNAEIGVGSDLVLLAFNLEFAYKMPLDDNPWSVYVGAGPALNILSFSDGVVVGGGTTLRLRVGSTSSSAPNTAKDSSRSLRSAQATART